MAERSHPITGIALNEITVLRLRRLTEAERRTARLMLMQGEARWLVAAQLGCHPLAIESIGPRTRARRTPFGGHLKAAHARSDERQMSLNSLMESESDGEEAQD